MSYAGFEKKPQQDPAEVEANAHVRYIAEMLRAHGESEEFINAIKYHYVSAWIHGVKHERERIATQKRNEATRLMVADQEMMVSRAGVASQEDVGNILTRNGNSSRLNTPGSVIYGTISATDTLRQRPKEKTPGIADTVMHQSV